MIIDKIYIEELHKEFIIKIGKNKHDNDLIVRQAKEDDLWFHFVNFSGPHIILETQNDISFFSNKKNLKYIRNVALKMFENISAQKKITINYQTKIMYTEIKNVKITNEIGCVNVSKFKELNFK